ncbi:hypothetical protein VL20_6483 [Microcystis panniformis FACHB-1757]|uniref:Uncharacterized protein n=1 Tax=Microcystis panniformis FACHB-1757 TaxID=1638788 RepID=A0A0K1SAR7_9CHRO|nr:hypothetical protein VL20_6483 [Microcystis panniformis FACHB-1757]
MIRAASKGIDRARFSEAVVIYTNREAESIDSVQLFLRSND